MSFPPTFLDELRSRLSLGQVVGRKVTWDTRKSNHAKGDLWAPCPFHQEKTASFHVDEKKGFYYCFGCHAKGDAISFVKESENVGFLEAVEILAREAGMQMPARDPRAQEKADRRSQLTEVMETAVRHYKMNLSTNAAGAAREYLSHRKLDAAALERFEIGFAPNQRQGLYQALTSKGVSPDLLVDAGLCARPDNGGDHYDRFRDRIIFPIRNAQGRAIAFGGRAMDPNAPAKYLNSPETELFDKGRSLYNHGPAREAAGKGQPLVVAEGYMDVIALAMAGFESAVAPLGTAVTEDQLRLLWRIHPEPIVALDGDRAGISAAMRLMDLALPLIEAGQSLRFAIMPAGKDPDDLIRESGISAMQNALDQAVPMVDLLWQRETEGKVFDSPERRAALDLSLREALKRIKDASLRHHYGEEIKRLRWDLFGNTQRKKTGGKSSFPSRKPSAPLASTRSSLLASGGAAIEDGVREAVILATLLAYPALVEEFEGPLEDLQPRVPEYERIRSAILRHMGDLIKIQEEIGADTLEKLVATNHVRLSPALRRTDDPELARMCLAEEFAKVAAQRGTELEVAEAMGDMEGLADEGLTWRLKQVAEAKARLGRSGTEDKTEYDIAPTGARLSRAEKDAFDELLAKIGFGANLGEEKVKK